MSRRLALALTSAAVSGAVALGGVALLVPTAAGASPTTVADSVAQQAQGTGRAKLLTQAQRQELRTTGHVTVTKDTKRFGTVTVLVQRGVVTALSATSITLRSKDGYVHSYLITKRTKVREKGQAVDLSDVKVGEKAMVVALSLPRGDVARRISCLRP